MILPSGASMALDICYASLSWRLCRRPAGSKAAEIRVTRAASDALFAAYESIRKNSELMATLPAKNRPEVNPLPTLNASIPPGNPHSSTEVGAAHSQTNPERAYGWPFRADLKQIRLQRLTLVWLWWVRVHSPYGPHRLLLPNCWCDWSVFRAGDSDGEQET